MRESDSRTGTGDSGYPTDAGESAAAVVALLPAEEAAPEAGVDRGGNPSGAVAVESLTEEFRVLRVDEIAPDPKNPRKTFDPAGLEELGASLLAVGMIEPLVVRAPVDGVHLLVAGERRWQAAVLKGIEMVPAIIRSYDPRQARLAQLTENLQRKSVDAVEEAEGFRELMDDFGYTAPQLAEMLGKKERVIYQRLALIEMPDAVKKAVRERRITLNHAILIARLRNVDHQTAALAYATEKAGVSVRGLDQWITENVMLKVTSAPFDRKDPDLLKSAGACGQCPKLTGNARGLFPATEFPSGDICTDRACYDEKIVQHINRAIAANRDLVQIKGGHGYWPKQPKHVYDVYSYTRVNKKSERCDSVADAIIVWGEGVGHQVQVCIAPKCEKHRPSHSGYYSPAEKASRAAEQKALKLKLEVTRLTRGRVVNAVLDASPVEVTTSVLETVVEQWWDDLGNDRRRIIRKRHPEWDADTLPVGDLSEAQLVRLLLEFSMASDLHVFSWGEQKPVTDGLRTKAEYVGVDCALIEQTVKAELADKGKKKAPSGKKAKSAKSVEDAKPFAVPDAEGRFSAADCEQLTFSKHGAEATIYIVRRAEGWQASYEVSIKGASDGGLPVACGVIEDSRAAAVTVVAEELADWTKANRTKANSKQAFAVHDWAIDQKHDAIEQASAA
jgi:ParB/RepB/Spo0J family partition protein